MSESIAQIQRIAWNTIETLLRKLLSGIRLSEEECSELSKSVRRYCGKVTIKALSLPRFMGLYSAFQGFLEKHITSLRNIALTLSGSDLISFYEESWATYNEAMECIENHFKYASRLLFNHHDHPYGFGFHKAGVILWQRGLLEVLRKEFIRAILYELAKERRGEKVPQIRLFLIMKSFIPEVDDIYFESEFLKMSTEFYASQDLKFRSPFTVSGYIEWAESIIQGEIKRTNSYLRSGALKYLTKIVSEEIFKDNMEIISKEFSNLLSEERFKELSELSGFLSKYESDLTSLAKIFESHVYDMGSLALSQVYEEAKSSPKIYVETIGALLSKFDSLLQEAFSKNLFFTRATDKAYNRLVNQNAITAALGGPQKLAEVLAKYSDFLLQKESNMAGSAFEGILLVLKVFRFVEDKDIFQRIYVYLLACRLLRNQSISEGYERLMINFLENECSKSYITMFNQMLADMKSSRVLFKEYSQWLERRSKESPIPGLISPVFRVLQSGFWPFLPDNDLTVPSELKNSMNSFHEFYSSKFNGRKLLWCYSLCSGEISSHYTEKSYIFEVSVYQMAILMVFNKADVYSISQIVELTNIEVVKLVPILEILLKTGVLEVKTEDVSKAAGSSPINEISTVADGGRIENKEQKAEINSQAPEVLKELPTVNMETKLTLCRNYHNDQIRINLNLPVRIIMRKVKEKNEEGIVECDRRMTIQSYITRIMKRKKRMTYKDLTEEVFEQTSTMFHPSLEQIKSNIEKLINDGYIRREPDDITIIEYIA